MPPITNTFFLFRAVLPTSSVCEDCCKVTEGDSCFTLTSDGTKGVVSVKIRKIVMLLRDIYRRSQGTEKTIVFSQFTEMLRIVGTVLKAENIKFVMCT